MIRSTPGLSIVPGQPAVSGIRVRLSDGDQGTLETLWAMRALIEHGARTAAVRRAVDEFQTRGSPMLVLRAVHAWLSKHVTYRDDAQTAPEHDGAAPETLRPVDAMLADVRRSGVVLADCDELSTLAGAILLALGFEVGLVVVGRDPRGPYQHVFAVVRYKHRLLSFDTQEGVTLDNDQRRFARRLVFPLWITPERMPAHLIRAV